MKLRLLILFVIAAVMPRAASAGWPFHHHRHHHGAYSAQAPSYAAQAPAYYMVQPTAFAQAAPSPQAGIVDIGTILTIIDRLQPRVDEFLDRRHERISGGGNGGDTNDASTQSLMDRLSKLEDSMKSKSDDTNGRIDNLTNITQSLGKQLVRISSRLDRRDASSDDSANTNGASEPDINASLESVGLRVAAKALEDDLRDLKNELGDSASSKMRASLNRAITDAHRIYMGGDEHSVTRSRRRNASRGNSRDEMESDRENDEESSMDDMPEHNRSRRNGRTRSRDESFEGDEGLNNRIDARDEENEDRQ